MKKMSKIFAIVLSIMMVIAISTTVFAVDDQAGTLAANGVVKNADHSSVGVTLNIPKGITVYGSMDKVYGPTVSYTYTIGTVDVPATPNTVTDFNNVTVQIKKGPADGVTLSDATAAFTSSEVSLTSGKAEITDNITVTVDPTKFANTTYGPGVYRYVITDTTNTSVLYASGITRSDTYDKTRYLDVYLKYNTTGNALEVYGYVLLATEVSPEAVDDQPLTWVTPTSKSSGYISSSETEALTDQYHTIDVTLTKEVTGDLGNKQHQFPFSFTVSNSGLTYYHKETVGTTASAYTDTTDTSVTGVKLADGEVYSIKGLNPKATISYTETNDTVDVYTLSVTDNADAAVNDSSSNAITSVSLAASGGAKTTAALAVSNYDTDNTASSVAAAVAASDNSAITFTNNLDAISPTGYVVRFAPYVLLLAAGITLIVVMRRRRNDEEADMI